MVSNKWTRSSYFREDVFNILFRPFSSGVSWSLCTKQVKYRQHSGRTFSCFWMQSSIIRHFTSQQTASHYFHVKFGSPEANERSKAVLQACFSRSNDAFILSITCMLCGLIRKQNPFRLFDYCKRSGSCI